MLGPAAPVCGEPAGCLRRQVRGCGVTRINLGIDVHEAARRRIAFAFDTFDRICVSFSGGKDSTVMLHMAALEARRRRRRIGVLFIDLEAQYALTIEHVQRLYGRYSDVVEPYWVALPLNLRNALSVYEPQWMCWEPGKAWVRQAPSMAITDEGFFPFFRRRMEFEEFAPAFGEWYSNSHRGCCLVGIRSQESLNRWRTVTSDKKECYDGRKWTTRSSEHCYNLYPIYDWKAEDIWTFHAKNPDLPYNRLYDRMHAAGLTIHQQRICQPYGDDQRKGLWLYQTIEPETWGRVVARVNGANAGALYAKDSGNILGRNKVTLPPGHTWESFAKMLLATMPEPTREHYQEKILVFLRWHSRHGYPDGIPDCGPVGSRETPSWKRICKALLSNDYWCKGLSFSQTKSSGYARYHKLMKKREAEWSKESEWLHSTPS